MVKIATGNFDSENSSWNFDNPIFYNIFPLADKENDSCVVLEQEAATAVTEEEPSTSSIDSVINAMACLGRMPLQEITSATESDSVQPGKIYG